MDLSNEEILKLVKEAKKNKAKLTHITNKDDLSTDDKFKIGLCKHFVQFANDKRYTNKKLHELTGIPTSRISEITNYKIKKFSVDQLFKYLEKLSQHSPKVREILTFLEHAVDVPLLKVTETKRLTRGLKEVKERREESAFLHA